MSELLEWPDDFDDPKPVTDFDVAFVAFLNQMRASSATVYADYGWAFFGFRRGSRSIDFVRRGRSRKLEGRLVTSRETYWEVLPADEGIDCRLGTFFGIREYACVVICGVSDIAAITTRWLDGESLADATKGVTFWDRLNPTSPLEVAMQS